MAELCIYYQFQLCAVHDDVLWVDAVLRLRDLYNNNKSNVYAALLLIFTLFSSLILDASLCSRL